MERAFPVHRFPRVQLTDPPVVATARLEGRVPRGRIAPVDIMSRPRRPASPTELPELLTVDLLLEALEEIGA